MAIVDADIALVWNGEESWDVVGTDRCVSGIVQHTAIYLWGKVRKHVVAPVAAREWNEHGRQVTRSKNGETQPLIEHFAS